MGAVTSPILEVCMRSTEGFLSIARGIDSVLLALLFVATSVHLGNAQGDPLTGTWKLNLGKSKYRC
jgi:hypothetical protein